MFVCLFYVLICVAVTEQRRASFGPRHLELQSGPECSVRPCHDRECRPYTVTTSNDFDLVPQNVTHVHLDFSANHSVKFDRATLPQKLGGQALVRLLMSVRYAPGRRLPSGFFVNLARLRSLQLYHNAPDSDHFSLRLSGGSFEGLIEVVALELAQLGIENLPMGVFSSLRSICRLDLSQNRLIVIRPDVFQPPPVSTPAGSTANHCCSNLTILSLSQNRFVDVADIHVSGLPSLKSVDLSENVIANLNRSSFRGRSDSTSGGFASITQLNLALNVIDHVDEGAFERLARLRVLYLDSNMISNVTASSFVGLPALETLDLSDNSICELRSGVFAPLMSLRVLQLAENAIKTVQTGAFLGVGKLQSLDLCDNELHSLEDGTFCGLEELEQLDVSHNQLVEVSARALAPVAGFLTYLNLFKNQLQTIDVKSLAAFDRLTFVNLENNSWTCNCSLWLPADVGSETLKSACELVVCDHPPAAHGKLLPSVLDQNYTDNCSPYTERPTRSPPLDFVDRWPIFIGIVMAVSLSGAVVSCLAVTVYESRRSAVWTPCHEVDATGSSENSSSSDDSDQKLDGVVVVAAR